MPVLARQIESAGIPTVVVSTMPDVSAAVLAPRLVGVEFPFGHPFGLPSDSDMQRHVLLAALRVLAGASGPGTRIDVDIEWPVPLAQAYRSWHPPEPSPLIAATRRAAPPGPAAR